MTSMSKFLVSEFPDFIPDHCFLESPIFNNPEMSDVNRTVRATIYSSAEEHGNLQIQS